MKKPTITKINLSEDQMKELTRLLKLEMESTRREDLIKKYVGGLCSVCGDIPTILVTYDVSDLEMKAQKIERYCPNCFERDKVKLLDTGQRNETIAIRESELKRLN